MNKKEFCGIINESFCFLLSLLPCPLLNYTVFSIGGFKAPPDYTQLAKHVYIFSTSLYRAVKWEIYWKILLNEQSNLCLLNASILFKPLAFLFKLQLCIIFDTSTVRFQTLIKAIKQFTYLIDQSQCTRWLYIEWFSWYNTALYLWLSDIWITYFIYLFYFFFFFFRSWL